MEGRASAQLRFGRRAAIIKAHSGQDFLPVIDELVKAAHEGHKPGAP